MARWVCIFEDTPQMLDIRVERRALHLAYLERNEGRILIAGGLSREDGEPPGGGLWVMEAADREEAKRIVENDPYFVPHCRSYRLFVWNKTLKDRTAVL
ncbi:YciI family protein [Xanthobacter sp. KR7-225]|uniref:YciI family protein n=1 Tax=Xanthobacter sp. KR7-225 TaxID=3156613 RepID=UPI0032B488A2